MSAQRPRASVYRAGAAELPDCLAVRRRVFIEGQSIPEDLDLDGLDSEASHFIARQAAAAVGTARLRRVGDDAKVERVAVLAEQRGLGLGVALMHAVEEAARDAGFARVVLSAQEPVIGFYEKLGYEAVGERTFEAGIPHRRMWKKL